MPRLGIVTLLLALALGTPQAGAAAQTDTPTLAAGTVMDAVRRLKPGEFLWAPQVAPSGPLVLLVNVATQRAVLYRNGVPIGVTTVSTGRAGHLTPLGVFTILEKQVEHYSSIYDNAPMPFMQRLTWGGVALHGGTLPGYPASHGCIRLPHEFARLLFGETRIGMTVMVVRSDTPRVFAPATDSPGAAMPDALPYVWTPEQSPSGPMVLMLSTADHRLVVIRNGREIGTARADVKGPVDQPRLFAFQPTTTDGSHWDQVPLPGQEVAVSPEFRLDDLQIDDSFRKLLATEIKPGTTMVITADSFAPVADATPAKDAR